MEIICCALCKKKPRHPGDAGEIAFAKHVEHIAAIAKSCAGTGEDAFGRKRAMWHAEQIERAGGLPEGVSARKLIADYFDAEGLTPQSSVRNNARVAGKAVVAVMFLIVIIIFGKCVAELDRKLNQRQVPQQSR